MSLTSYYYFKLNRMRERERDNLLGTFSSHLNAMADGLHVSDDMWSNHVSNISSPDRGRKRKKKNNNTPVPISQPSRTYSVNFFSNLFPFFFIYFFGKRKISFRSFGDRKASLTSSFFPLSLSLLLLRNNIEKHPWRHTVWLKNIKVETAT
jgi:hypothetical protein